MDGWVVECMAERKDHNWVAEWVNRRGADKAMLSGEMVRSLE
jgi:hypothetical protein